MTTMYRIGMSALFLLAVMLTGCKSGQPEIVITNAEPLMRVDEPVIMSRADLESRLGKLPAGTLPVLVSASGDTLAVQHDDRDGDGLWDEMLVLVTQDPEQTASYSLAFVAPVELPVPETRTSVRFARIQDGEYIPLITAKRLTAEEGLAGGVFQMEGPAWENEKVAFRNYFDVRNGMDIFGKTTRDMVLHRVGINEDYHYKQDWGQDILRVGASLGSGSLALELDGKLYRVGPGAEAYYELVNQGPLRSTIRFTFSNWMIEGEEYELVHDIDILAGTWYYTSRVTLTKNPGNATLIAGITTIDLPEKSAQVHIDQSVVTIATHGPQAYDYEMLGMAIMLKEDAYAGYFHTEAQSDIPLTFAIRMQVAENEPVVFRYYACWDYSEPRFTDPGYFMEFLMYESAKWAKPLKVTIN